MRGGSWLLAVVVAAGVGCATHQSSADWVLVRSAAEGEMNTPIYAWQQIKRFPTAEECARYHADLLDQAVSAGSREKLEAAYHELCMPAERITAPAPR